MRDRWSPAIKGFFQFLVDAELLAHNPCATIPSPRLERRERRVLHEREYQMLQELAREPGISPEAIIPETEARTTREEAVRVSARLQLMGVRRILLVTDSLHMTRAQQLFERAGVEVLTAPADDCSNAADS